MTTTETTTLYVPCPECGATGIIGVHGELCMPCAGTGEAPCYCDDVSISVPVAGLGERAMYRAPRAWHARIAAMVPVLNFGEHYSRSAREKLTDMSYAVRGSDAAVAREYLLAAERFAAREFGMGDLNGLTFAQARALSGLCGRYNVEFDASHYSPSFDLPDGYVAGWVGGKKPEVDYMGQIVKRGSIYVGCSPEGGISS